MNLYLTSFNNYYNRTIKKYDTLSNYDANSSHHTEILSINFKPNDSVNTIQIVNWTQSWNPDYLVTYSGTKGGDNEEINSRWFIIEMRRLREQQFELTLRRDVIADNLSALMNADCFIEKGIVNPTDVAIYNQEEIDFNKIKKSETLLKDKTQVGWLVGFLNTTYSANSITVPDIKTPYIVVNTISGSEFGPYIGTNYKYASKENLTFAYNLQLQDSKVDLNIGDNVATITNVGVFQQHYNITTSKTGNALKEYMNNALTILSDNKISLINSFNTQNGYKATDILSKYDGKLVYAMESDGTYAAGFYYIKLTKTTAPLNTWVNDDTTMQAANTLLTDAGYTIDTWTGTRRIYAELEYTTIGVSCTSFSGNVLTFNYTASANRLVDAPYKMFAIPYGYVGIAINSPLPTYETRDDVNVAMNIAITLALNAGSNLYDLQLLPYCPMREAINPSSSVNVISTQNLTENQDFEYIKDSNGNIKHIILFPKISNFSFDTDLVSLTAPTTAKNIKIENQCNSYRLVSPNYNSIFEFNLAKNGSVAFFNIDCTFKPYNSYIHINPNFGLLYGKDFNDARGLIITGDFSVPLVQNKWIEYQIQNKNYQNAFDRQIENLEINQKYQRVSDIAGAISGTVQGAASGVMISGGNPVGAIVGGVASGAAGIADVAINEKLRSEAIDYTKDQFNYNLQNIQAQPNALMKVSSYDYNNKIFPILEFYSCTDQEKEIFVNKMKFNGMKVMRIDKPINFVSTTQDDFYPRYIKGKIIRISIEDDTHLANELANEFYKGVFSYGDTE